MSIVSDTGEGNHLLRAALEYAARGWHVLPLHYLKDGHCSCEDSGCGRAGKHPLGALVSHGAKNASTDPKQFKKWWSKVPAANVGIATGPASGIFVVGPDGEQGIADLAGLERAHGPLPATPIVGSGSGGRHRYFAWPSDGLTIVNRRNHRGLKIDVRGEGGLIVAPPSRNAAGPYKWLVVPQGTIAEAPPWLLAWVRSEAEGSAVEGQVGGDRQGPVTRMRVGGNGRPDARIRASEYLKRCAPAISGQGGHNQTFTVARAICWGFDLGADEGFELLRDHYNPLCKPPWSEAELRHKCSEADIKPFDKSRGWLLAEGEPPPTGHPGPELGTGQGEAAAGDGQEDIENIPLPEPPPWPTLGAEALHGLLGEIVETLEPQTEADPVGILGQLLVAVGNAIGRKPFFQVEGTKHYSNIMVMTCGKTAHGRKGTAWDRTIQVMELADQEWAGKRVQSGLSSGEGLIYHVRDAVQRINSKGETEVVDEGVKDKRLLALETEFAQVLRILKREGNTLSTLIRQAWDRGNLTTLTRNNPIRATDAHISIIGHTTQEDLAEYLGRVEMFNGFANRILWLLVRRSKILPDGGEAVDLSPLALRLGFQIASARNIGRMQRDQRASGLWHQIYPWLSEDRRGLYGAATSRAEAQVLRLSMLYALVDGKGEIGEAHLRAALALWAYAEESARLIFGAEADDPLLKLILARLREGPAEGMTRTQLRDAFQRNLTGNVLVQGLAQLRDKGKIECWKIDTGGRKAERWRIRPNDRNDRTTEPGGAGQTSVVPSFGRSVVGCGEEVVTV